MGQRWLSPNDSGYLHITHIQAQGHFGYGAESTSNIESVWANLKSIIKRIYNFIPHQNFILYLRESKFRRNISHLNYDMKIKEI